MDWNTILFAVRWAIIALFYAVLLMILFGVYREGASRLGQKPETSAVIYGRLRVLDAGSDPHIAAGAILALKPVTALGAMPDNDIVLEDRYISKHHLQLHWDGTVWWLEDLQSKNGTQVNDQPVPPGQPQPLVQGAVIKAGGMVLELTE